MLTENLLGRGENWISKILLILSEKATNYQAIMGWRTMLGLCHANSKPATQEFGG